MSCTQQKKISSVFKAGEQKKKLFFLFLSYKITDWKTRDEGIEEEKIKQNSSGKTN